MRILVLGGTAWLGGQIAATAATRGHDVSCLARGESGSVPDGVALVRGDRGDVGAYDGVPGYWDAVLDVTRHPGHVRSAIDGLGDRLGTYLFVSTGNVYADHGTPGADESAELMTPHDGDLMDSMEVYGPAKVACELALLDRLGPDRVAIARSGLIGGPGDVSGRTGYWPLRFARPSNNAGDVLVPAAPDADSQLIDVRDLSGFLVDCAERHTHGVFNTVGQRLPFGAHVETAREVGGVGAPVFADSDWLLEQGVAAYMGERSLPMWLPIDGYAGWSARSNEAALAAGMTLRPLRDTLQGVLEWELEQDPGWDRGAGLTDEQERELLAAWSDRTV